MTLALLLALSLPASAQTPQAVVSRAIARAEKLVAAQKGVDARTIRDLDREAEGLYKDIKPLGWKAAPALAAAISDRRRPAKVRLFAVSFLALIRDPAAFPPLEDILLDKEQDPTVRALAAQSLPGQGAPDASVSAALCGALAQEDLPREVLDDVMMSLGRLGCRETPALVRLARAFGPRPGAKDLPVVTAAIGTLGRSRGAASGRELLALVGHFPPRGEARAAAIKALDARRPEIARWLAPEALPVVAEALRSESERWDTMLPLIRLAVALGPDAGPALSRLSDHPDAEVLAEAAEAMVLFKRVEAAPRLEAVVAGAMSDPRFSPKEGRPDPASLLARIEKAAAALRHER
jgi:HEAT repeat protein